MFSFRFRLLTFVGLVLFLYLLTSPVSTHAQTIDPQALSTSSTSVTGLLLEGNPDLVDPKQDDQNGGIFAARPVESFSLISIVAYWIQTAVAMGIPSNTVVLVLLLPILATIITFTRVIVGIPSLEMLVPIALAYTFVALGVTLGLVILGATVAASLVSRVALKHARIMYLPKRSVTMLFLSLFVFAALTFALIFNIPGVRELSIFPVIILALLGDSIVNVQMRSSARETLIITTSTILLGLFGFFLATTPAVRDAVLVYPELVFLTIPLNILMGRYFGLRLSEYFRFYYHA